MPQQGADITFTDDPYDRTPVAAALSAGFRETARAFQEEAVRSRPTSAAASVNLSTRPPSAALPLMLWDASRAEEDAMEEIEKLARAQEQEEVRLCLSSFRLSLQALGSGCRPAWKTWNFRVRRF